MKQASKSKPQNWNGAKGNHETYFCLLGCEQRVPRSEEAIHEEHCPAKRSYLDFKKETRKFSKKEANLRASGSVVLESKGGCSVVDEVDDSEENWDEELNQLTKMKDLMSGKFSAKKEANLPGSSSDVLESEDGCSVVDEENWDDELKEFSKKTDLTHKEQNKESRRFFKKLERMEKVDVVDLFLKNMDLKDENDSGFA